MEHFNSNTLQQRPDIRLSVTVLLLCFLVFTGLWTRFWGLGDRILAEDEYFFVKSAQNILEYGFPRFPSGGYYVRGIPLQYVTAISIFFFGDGGFAYRLPSALFGVGTLVMAYFLGRQFFNRSWSIVLVALLTFSSWEIEFARFARMYAAFQFIFVCFFWSLYRYSFNGISPKRYLAVAFGLMAVLTHELGVFIVIFLFMPFPVWFNRGWRKTLTEQRFYIAISSILLGAALFWIKYNFRFSGVSNHLPLDYVAPAPAITKWLSFGTDLFGHIAFLSIAAIFAVSLVGWYMVYTFRSHKSAPNEAHWLCGLLAIGVCFAFFHQFSMVLMILLIILLREPKVFFKRPYTYLIGLLAVIFVFWVYLLLFSQSGGNIAGERSIVSAYLRSIRLAFFVFPDLYMPVIKAWAENLPVLGILLGAGISWQIICIRKLSLTSIVRNPVIPVVMIFAALGFEPPSLIRTRYSHFLYPLVLCVGLLTAIQLGEALKCRFIVLEKVSKILLICFCLLLFGISEDFNAFHLTSLNSDDVAFRIGRYEKQSLHWYQRFDYQRPAELVNASASDSSKIIISEGAHTAGAYLRKEFAVYWPRESVAFSSISREGGTRELWSGRLLLNTFDDLKKYTQNTKSVWLVMLPGWGSLDPEVIWRGRVLSVEIYKPGRDKRIEVWKIELI